MTTLADEKINLIDIHCHLAASVVNYPSKVEDMDDEITHVSTALSSQEIAFHDKMGVKYWFAGLHPQDSNMTNQEINEFLSKLPYEKITGIGEIGLDRRFSEKKRQIDLLHKQLELAIEYDLPSLYHLVGYEYDFIVLQRKKDLPRMKIIHGFNSSFEVYKELDKLGFYFSLGSRLLQNPKKRKTIEAILREKRFFLESDATDFGNLEKVKIIAEIIERDYNISIDEIKEIETRNFKYLLKETCESLSKK